MKFGIKQLGKMTLQNIVFPMLYSLFCLFNKIDEKRVIIADAHHDSVPVSLVLIGKKFENEGYDVKYHIYDYSHASIKKVLMWSIQFLKEYSKAHYVMICDNFLPASSCNKRKNTKLIQMTHSCGAFKKMGFDTPDDIPLFYVGNVYKGYDLVITSSDFVTKCISSAMNLSEGIAVALGSSRTDRYFDELWKAKCRKKLDDHLEKIGESKGKKILLWAPTFRGHASNPTQIEMDFVNYLSDELSDEWIILVKVHPAVDLFRLKNGLKPLSNIDMVTEDILPFVDLLITDYSSVVNEFMIFEKPVVLYAPDLIEYSQKRGFYVNYSSISKYVASEKEEVPGLIAKAYLNWENKLDFVFYRENKILHVEKCDGNSTNRIFDYIIHTL